MITLTNHNLTDSSRGKEHNDPSKNGTKSLIKVNWKAEKRVRKSHEWLWFHFWTVDKVASKRKLSFIGVTNIYFGFILDFVILDIVTMGKSNNAF